jgi:hypothetical protein|tara:strand:+ start:15 stop:662 length:648 start_codon:yes stop_codon:yes gene_type:complete
MEELDINHIPTIIDTTLYRYNYIDYRMWALMRNQLDYKEMGRNSIIISSQQLKTFIAMNYQDEINKVSSYGFQVPRKDATSIYFMHRVSTEMVNLKYIKLTLDSDKSYSRVIEEDEDKTIKYDFAILKATLNLSDIFDQSPLTELNKILEEIGLLTPGKPYFNGQYLDILNRLEIQLAEIDKESRRSLIILALLEALDVSINKENPMLMVITDYA